MTLEFEKILLQKGIDLLSSGNITAAVNVLEDLVIRNPTVSTYRGWLARSINAQGDYDRALEVAEKALKLDPKCTIALFARGDARCNKGELAGAIADFSEAIRLDPTFAYAHNNRGIARAAKGDLDGAITDCSAAIRVDPTFAYAYYNRALARHNKGDLDGAITDYSAAIRLEPEYAAPYNNRGLVRSDKGDLDGAISDYSSAIRIDPTFAYAYNNRGIALRAKGDLDGAITDSSAAIRVDPTFAYAYYNRALARHNKGDLDGAIADYSETIRLDPDNAYVYYNRALARRNKGELEGAIADMAHGYVHQPRERSTSSKPKIQAWFDQVHQHFGAEVLPTLKRSNERFVEYYPSFLFWGRQERIRRQLDGKAVNAREGRYGTGYICVTDKNLWLISLGNATKRLPFQQSGLLDSVFNVLAGESDRTIAEHRDQVWTLPWQSVGSIQPSTNARTGETFIWIASGPGWEIYTMDPDLHVLTALNMGKLGMLTRIFSNSA